MIVSHDKKFIFFHLYKVAGRSVREALNKYGCEKTYKSPPDKGGSHIRPAQLKGRVFNGHKGEDLLRDYFTFSFVRNPWDWLVSHYFFVRSNKKRKLRETYKNTTFEEYLEWKINGKDIGWGRGPLMQPNWDKKLAAGADPSQWRLQPQYMFLSENLNLESPIAVDFVGKYEYLDSDFSKICDILDLDCPRELPHRGKTFHEDYRSKQGPLGSHARYGGTNHYTEYYTDKTRKMVEDAFSVDIDYFGYDFNNEKIVSGGELYLNKI